MYALPTRPARDASPGTHRWTWRVLLLLLTFASLGFEWQGRVDQLSQELRVAEAGRRRDIVRLLSSYGSPRAREAILAALTDPDPEVRAEAAEACGRLRLVEAIPELSEWLLDPLGETRAAAARALGAMNDAGSLPALIRTLGDTSAEVRIAAINALSSLGGDEVVTPLLGRLDDDDVTVRIAAASALGSLGDERAVVPLIGRARDDSAEVRVAVFTALGALGDVRALSALALGTRDTVEDARLTATLALGQLRSPRAIDPLRALLEQPDMRLRSAALDALAPIPDPRASGVILDALGGLPGAQAIAMEALVQRARSGLDETLVPALAERLGTATHQHATAIGRILSEIARTQPDERAVPALLEALRTGRGASAPLLLALGRLGGDVALVPILEHIGSSDAGTRDAALDALEAYFERWGPDGRATDPLLDALPSARGAGRLRVVALLGTLAERRALPALRPLLTHSDTALRRAALRSLGALGDPGSADALYPLLEDEDAETRYEVAVALGQVMDAHGVERVARDLMGSAPRDRHALLVALTAALRRVGSELSSAQREELARQVDLLVTGRDRALAARAMHALTTLGSVAGGPRLREHALRGHGALRHQALGALGELGDPESMTVLRAGLVNTDTAIAAASASALGRAAALAALQPDDVTALLAAMDRPFPVPTAASYVLARLAREGRLLPSPSAAGDGGAGAQPSTVRAALCGLLSRREPHVRANILVALAALGHERCGGRLDPSAWMTAPHQLPVRAAAAHFLAGAAQSGGAAAAEWNGARAVCRERELTESLLELCRSGEPQAATDAPSRALRTYAFAADQQTVLANHWVVLRFADGSAFAGFTDLNGYLSLDAVPTVDARLELPETMPLEP
ncbi:MAG: HEAT repeat domain-containing protein [Myxococcales bacterium]|nr:HEAT repeat domain-containing protein [Myxococcales bacterium]